MKNALNYNMTDKDPQLLLLYFLLLHGFGMCVFNFLPNSKPLLRLFMAAAQLPTISSPLPLLLFSVLLQTFFFHCSADVGTASQYPPPYSPTGCYGSDPSQFPTSNLFAAAGEGIWDNGAACGRQYLVRCISASRTGVCFPGQTVQIRIVDYAMSSSSASVGATLVLSQTAFGSIANASATSINVEYQLV